VKHVVDRIQSLYRRLTSGGTTEEQAVHGGIWVAGINVGDRVLQLLKIVVLARLLSPEAFGLLGIALLVRAALEKFSELGFDQALIQHRNEDVDAYLNTAWMVKIGRGLVIAVVAFVSAPYLAAFFSEPRSEPLIQVLGAAPLVLGLQNPAVVYFQKRLNFHKEFVYQVGGRVVDLCVAVALALVFRSVWALAGGILAMTLTKLVVSYVVHDYRPRLEFDRERAEEMFSFGKWLFASSILVFLFSQGDDAFVGWFFGATALGFYQLAYRFSNAPATEVTHVISRVAFPAFSKVQDDTERLRDGFFEALQLTAIIGFPVAGGIVAVAPQFVDVVLGTQWRPMIPLIQVLALWGLLRAVGSNVGPVLRAIGRPDILTRLQLLKVVLIAAFIFPAASQFGVVGVAALLIGNTLVVQPINYYLTLTEIEGRASRVLSVLAYPFAASLVMGGCVYALDRYAFAEPSPVGLVALVLTGVLVYVGAMVGIERTVGYRFTDYYRELKRSLS
jgi:O-antigen/teichoic acid export membrane protein